MSHHLFAVFVADADADAVVVAVHVDAPQRPLRARRRPAVEHRAHSAIAPDATHT